MIAADETAFFEVEAARLEHGAWCHRAEKTLGQGDIAASYSADRIGMDQPVRKPFEWRGGLWVCVGSDHRRKSAEVYRLVHPNGFEGQPTTYREKTRDCDAARADPKGFYHGMAVRHAGARMILSGPPVTFVPGQTQQLDLFGEE